MFYFSIYLSIIVNKTGVCVCVFRMDGHENPLTGHEAQVYAMTLSIIETVSSIFLVATFNYSYPRKGYFKLGIMRFILIQLFDFYEILLSITTY